MCLEEKGDVVVWWISVTDWRIGDESMTDRFDEGNDWSELRN